jgi:hypothetical protein
MKHLQIAEISHDIYRMTFTTDEPGRYEVLGREIFHPEGERIVSHCITMRAEHIARELIKLQAERSQTKRIPFAPIGDFFSTRMSTSIEVTNTEH